jgi:hypothetical protein
MRHIQDIYISKRISNLLRKCGFQGLDKIFENSSFHRRFVSRSVRQRVVEVVGMLAVGDVDGHLAGKTC